MKANSCEFGSLVDRWIMEILYAGQTNIDTSGRRTASEVERAEASTKTTNNSCNFE